MHMAVSLLLWVPNGEVTTLSVYVSRCTYTYIYIYMYTYIVMFIIHIYIYVCVCVSLSCDLPALMKLVSQNKRETIICTFNADRAAARRWSTVSQAEGRYSYMQQGGHKRKKRLSLVALQCQ